MRSIATIRLLFGFFVTLFSVWFVKTYSEWSLARFKWEHQNENFTINTVNQLLLDLGKWLYLVPVLVLATGLLLVFRHPKRLLLFEIVVQMSWFFALASALFAILTWQGENIPVLHLHGPAF